MNKHDALAKVRVASIALAMAQPGYSTYTPNKFRAANAAVALAQLHAVEAGASAGEVSAAAEWNGRGL